MRLKNVGKRVLVLTFIAAVLACSGLIASASQNEALYTRTGGRTTIKYEASVNWEFYSHVAANLSDIGTTEWRNVNTTGAGAVTAKRAVISESASNMSIGYMSCSYDGTSMFSNKMIITHTSSGLGGIRSNVVYGIELWEI